MVDPQAIYTLLNEIYLILDDGDRHLLNRFSLSPSRFYALAHIGDRPGISISELSNLMLCDKSNATRIVKGLESLGLAKRRPHETDGRTLRLFLTEEGENLRRRAISSHLQYNRARFEKLGENHGDDLLENLRLLKRSLRRQLEEDDTRS